MSYSEIARSICQPRDKQPKSAPARSGRAARTRVGTFNSPARRRDVLVRLTERVNARNGVVTVAEQLRDRGASVDIERRYASAVGRKVAANARAIGVEPQQTGLAVAGRKLVPAFGYTNIYMIDAVIDGYEMADPRAPKSRKAPRVRLVDLIGS